MKRLGMKRNGHLRGAMGLLVLGAWMMPAALSALTLEVRPTRTDGVYALNEVVGWNIAASGSTATLTTSYTVRRNGGDVIAEGQLDLNSGAARLELASALANEPSALLLRVSATPAGGSAVVAHGGAVVEPEKIRPANTKPDDFDAFWEGKLAHLRAHPMNAVLTPETSNRSDVQLWSFTLEMPDGSLARGQIARPVTGEKFPAMIILQYAGIYALSKGTVVNRAAEGWLALNVMAHDLPIYESNSFYQEQQAGPLNGYGMQGNHDREEAYLLGMLLRAMRATDYLTGRDDWDGENLVATGTSKGGYQAIVVAGLEPRFTAVAANVPAACEMVGQLSGRAQPWPYWMNRNVTPFNRYAVIDVSAYFDTVNFASRVRAPVLVSLGLLDTTCPPAGVLSMAAQLKGPREVIIMPLAPHQSANNAHAAFYDRSTDFLNNPPPVLPPPYAPAPLDPWSDADEAEAGMLEIPAWGSLYLQSDPVHVYHDPFGWLYLADRNPAGFNLYSLIHGWRWTTRNLLPWAWDYQAAAWINWAP